MTKFLAVVSGKGGVGKTTCTLNLGQALTNLGKKTLVLDANLVTPNIAIQLGFMNPEGTVNRFLRGEKNIQEITYLHESGLSVIPASPSYAEFQKTNAQKLTEVFEHLNNLAEYVLVDSPSGLGYDVHQILKNCDEALIVATPNLSSVIDALKTIEIAKANHCTISGILLNMSNKGRHELTPEEVENYLNFPILGNVRLDKKIRKSLHKQQPLNYLYPRSRSAKQFQKVAEYISLQHELQLKE